MFGPIGCMTLLSNVPGARYVDVYTRQVTLFTARRRIMRSQAIDADEQLVLAMLWEDLEMMNWATVLTTMWPLHRIRKG